MPRGNMSTLVRPEEGRISRRIFWDEDIYREEMERIFAKTWLYVGHESQIPKPGDYMQNYVGEDPVLVTRDDKGDFHVFLNSCPHRGMKICRADAGNTAFFRCPYHGWTFGSDGRLVGVPRYKTAYLGELDRSAYNLFEIPMVRSYKGLIFACWDPHVISLDDWLGDLKWYLDIILARHLGDLKVLTGVQKYVMRANWKSASDNFAGDTHHVLHTHLSAFKLGYYPSYDLMGDYQVSFRHGHGLADIPQPNVGFKFELEAASQISDEAADYVRDLQRVLDERIDPAQAALFKLGVGNVFPNFSLNDYISLVPYGLFQWHPKGPACIEIWQAGLFDDGAPDSLKHFARVAFTQAQAVAGFFGQDDSENFEQVTKATGGYVSQMHDFDYSMAVGRSLEIDGMPGDRISQKYSEENQRNFYRGYLELMDVS